MSADAETDPRGLSAIVGGDSTVGSPGGTGSPGQAGSAGPVLDCASLAELRSTMKVLVATQKAKWAYMFAKIDKELGK